MYFWTFQICLLICFSFCASKNNSTACVADEILNLKVYTEFDLTGRFLKTTTAVDFINKGFKSLKKYKYVVDEFDEYRIEFFNYHGQELNFKKIILNASTIVYYEVSLGQEILENQEYTLICKVIFANRIVPAAKTRKIYEDQVMKFQGKLKFFSAYQTDFSEVAYLLRENSLREITTPPMQVEDKKITYFFYNVSCDRQSEHVEITFVNNDPFLVVERLYKTIDVNHFGKITIQDDVVLRNSGPKFVGSYTIKPGEVNKAMSLWLQAYLPASAENIEFFDILGNSSQTTIKNFFNYSTLKFKTRYPLLGGWQTFYSLRYQLPIYEYLFIYDNTFFLKTRSIDYIVDDQFIKEALVEIMLPEGAIVKAIHKPPNLHVEHKFGRPSGLCFNGREIIMLKGSNLYDVYVETVFIQYFFNSLWLLRGPLVISIYLECVFLIILVGNYVFF